MHIRTVNDVTIRSTLRCVVQVLMRHFTIFQSHGLSGWFVSKIAKRCLKLSKLRPNYYRSIFFRTRCRFVKNLCMAYIASWRNMLTRSGVEATSSWKLKMCTQCFTVSIWWVWNNSMNTHLTTKPNDYISGSTEKITFGLNEMTFSSWRTGSQDITCREAIAVYLFTIRWQGWLITHGIKTRTILHTSLRRCSDAHQYFLLY